MDNQQNHHLALLRRIAAGATTITKSEDVTLMDEFVQLGYVDALESVLLGERYYLDVQIMPLGEAHLRNLDL